MASYLVVDGYNLLYAFAEQEGKTIKDEDFDELRDHLVDRVANYSALAGFSTTLVFDAWASSDDLHEEQESGIKVVFTGKDQTADSYIERTLYNLPRKAHVVLATSDSAIQDMALLTGAERISSRQFIRDVMDAEKTHELYQKKKTDPSINKLGDHLDEKSWEQFNKWRFGQS